MRRSSLFGHIAELLDLVFSSRQPADLIVKEFYRKRHYLGARDRRYISDHLFGIVRHHTRLGVLLRQAIEATRNDVRMNTPPAVGFCAAYALHVEGESVDTLLPDFAGLWRMATTEIDPGVFLRRLSDTVLPDSVRVDPPRWLSTFYSLPEFAVREWIKLFGQDEAEQLCRSLNESAPIVLRANTLRGTVDECRNRLAAENVETRRTALSPYGVVLSKRVNLQNLAAFREGWCEPQDEGSQLLGLVVGVSPGLRVVDMCAGGGGKTLHMAALMENRGEILALDVDGERLKQLRMRALRAGATNVRTSVIGGAQPIPEGWREAADAVLVDAPCSGIGIFRRNPGAKLHFSESGIEMYSEKQLRILAQAAEYVKPGGRLVYATCSLLSAENDDVVRRFLGLHSGFQLIDAPALLRSAGVPLESAEPYLCLFPHRHTTDGFFAAAMVRAS